MTNGVAVAAGVTLSVVSTTADEVGLFSLCGVVNWAGESISWPIRGNTT